MSWSSVLVRVRPIRARRDCGVAHGDDDAAGTDIQRFAADGVLVFQLEVFAHLARGQRSWRFFCALGEREDDEEGRGEDDSAYCGD